MKNFLTLLALILVSSKADAYDERYETCKLISSVAYNVTTLRNKGYPIEKTKTYFLENYGRRSENFNIELMKEIDYIYEDENIESNPDELSMTFWLYCDLNEKLYEEDTVVRIN